MSPAVPPPPPPSRPPGGRILWVSVAGICVLATAWCAHLLLTVAGHQASVHAAAAWLSQGEGLRDDLLALGGALGPGGDAPLDGPSEAVVTEALEGHLQRALPALLEESSAWVSVWRTQMADLGHALGAPGAPRPASALEESALAAAQALGEILPRVRERLHRESERARALSGWLQGLVGLLAAGGLTLLALHLRVMRQRQALRQAFEAIAENEQRYRNMFEQNTASQLLISPGDGTILDANPAACAFYGTPLRALRGTTLLDLSAGGAPQARELATIVQGLSGGQAVLAQQLANGARRTVELRTSPVTVGGRRLIYAIVQDVTDRVRLEQEMHRVKSLESLALLAGGVAHDFDNFLASLIGSLHHLNLRLANDPESRPAVLQAQAACQRAQSLTRQLRAYARGEDITLEPVRLPSLLRDTATFAVKGRQTTVELDLPEALPWVRADEGQIAQVVHNLVLNASQAMKDAGRVTVVARRAVLGEGEVPGLGAGEFVRIAVGDQGGGIPPENLDRLFQPYFTTKPKGTGLGLAMSYSTLRKHGGMLTVESRPGDGCTFYVYLPAIADADLAGPRRESAPRVLVVAEDPAVREIGRKDLVEAGFEVLVAKDAEQCALLLGPGRVPAAVLIGLAPDPVAARAQVTRLRPLVGDALLLGLAPTGAADLPQADAGLDRLLAPEDIAAQVRAVLADRGAGAPVPPPREPRPRRVLEPAPRRRA